MRRASPRPKRQKKASSRASKEEDQSEDDALPTELCLGSDGLIYVNAEGVNPEMLKGRKLFHGFAMTPEEASVAVEELHRLAFNVTIAVQQVLRERRARRLKRKARAKRKADS
jgi:hypothetical protein